MKRKILYIAIGILFSLGLTVLANTSFDIDDTFFVDTGISSGYYSPLHFNFDGNNFDGIVFWGDDSTNTGELTLGSETITCDKQLEGLYINTARGNKVWPLDQDTLDELSGSSNFSGYDDLTMTGGFFTQCTGIAEINSDEIYGYIEHESNGEIYKLWAGVEYDFDAGTATGNFDGTLKYINGGLNNSSSGYLFDTYGGIASVYSNLDLYGNIVFTGSEVFWSGANYYSTGTTIQISMYSNKDVSFNIAGDIATEINGNLSAGSYIDQNIVLTSGNGTKNIQFTVSTGSESDTDSISVILDVPAAVDTTPPTVTLNYPTNGLTATSNSLTFQWNGSDNVAVSSYNLYINGSGNFSRINIVNESQIVNPLTNGNYTWYVVATDSSGNTGQSATYSLTVASAYAGPTLVNPINGADIDLGDLLLSRTGTSSSGYLWQIATDTGFTNIVATGETNGTSIDPIHNPDFMLGTFYWRVINNQNAGVSDYRFVNIVEPSEGIDLEVDKFEFDDKDDARLSESYNSNKVDITGITDHVYIPIELEDNIGALFINSIMVGSDGQVKAGDEVYIELLSSNDYDDRSSSKLIVGEGNNKVSDIFRIYTKQKTNSKNEFELSYSQKLQAITLLDSLMGMYDNNPEKLSQFLTTFKAILKDKSDLLADDIDDTNNSSELELLRGQKASVDYLYDIIDNYIDNIPHESSSVYIAPNGKQYITSYNADRFAYTSPDFISEKYFPTWEIFTHHIDINNPGSYSSEYHGGSYYDDGYSSNSGVGEMVTAPNHKTYYIYQISGKRTSDEFAYKRYFDTRDQIINYISINNHSKTWDHKIDTSFAPVYLTAPNGRRYTIFKTSSLGANANKYSSFSFVTPKYFNSLQATKDHIIEYNR